MPRKVKLLKSPYPKSILFISAAALILILFCAVQLLRPNQTFHWDADYSFTEGESTTDTPIFEQLSLHPGIYRVQLSYTASEGASAVCTVTDGNVFCGGLLSDGTALSANEPPEVFRLMLFESTDSLRFNVSYHGTGSLKITGVTIVETDQLWSRLIVLTLFAAALSIGCIRIFSQGCLSHLSPEQKHRLSGLFLIGFLGSLPFWMGGTPYVDSLSGQLSALMSIDRNLLYVIPALLYRLGFTASACHTFYCTALTVATACISQYCFEGFFGDYRIGLACSGIYTLSIYRIYRLILYGLIDEAGAYTFLPLILYGLYLLLFHEKQETDTKGWLTLAVGYAGILQTHIPTWLITVCISAFLCLFAFRSLKNRKSLMAFLKAILGSLLFSLWYLLPLLVKTIQGTAAPLVSEIRAIQEKGIYVAHLLTHFWVLGKEHPAVESSLMYSMPSGLGLIFVVALLLFCILWFSGKLRQDRTPLTYFAKLCAVAGALCMLLSLRHFPWDKLQFLNSVTARLVSLLDSPVLFLGWAGALLTFLAGFCLARFLQKEKILYFYIGILIVSASITTSPMYLTDYIGRDLPHVIICDAATTEQEGGTR